MASSDKVYVCGKCEEFGAPNLEDLVAHMSNCQNLNKQERETSDNQEEENSDNQERDDHDEDIEESAFYEDESSENNLAPQTVSDSPSSAKKRTDVMKGRSQISGSESSYAQYAIIAEQSTPTPFHWNKKAAHLLVKVVKSHKPDLESSHILRRTVWLQISIEMQAKYGYCVTATQCMNKFKYLTKYYRRTRDNKFSTKKNTCMIYQELDDYYSNSEREQSKLLQARLLNEEPRQKQKSRYQFILPKEEKDSTETKSVPTVTEQKSSLLATNTFNNSVASNAESIFVFKLMETFERCHRESMKMQREFIDALKKAVQKT